MSIASIAYYQINNLPLIAYLGLITLLSFSFTASIAIMNKHGINWIPFKWHPRMAKISLLLGFIHGFLVIASRFF